MSNATKAATKTATKATATKPSAKKPSAKAKPTMAAAVAMATNSAKPESKPATAKKTAQKAPQATPATPAAKVEAATAYATQDKAAPYSVFHTNLGKGAYTAAALIVSGFLTMGKGAPIQSGKPGNVALFAALVGKTASGYWKRNGLIDGGKVTKAGINKIGARLDNTAPTYRTELEAIKALAETMKKGGTAEAGGEKIALTRKVIVTA